MSEGTQQQQEPRTCYLCLHFKQSHESILVSPNVVAVKFINHSCAETQTEKMYNSDNLQTIVSSIVTPDVSPAIKEITYNELKNAALTLQLKNTPFDLNWTTFIAQFQTAVHNLPIDSTCLVILSQMIEYVKQNVDVIQTSVYHSVLFALEQRDREELDQKKKQDQAKTRATQRASKRKLTKTNTITKPCV